MTTIGSAADTNPSIYSLAEERALLKEAETALREVQADWMPPRDDWLREGISPLNRMHDRIDAILAKLKSQIPGAA